MRECCLQLSWAARLAVLHFQKKRGGGTKGQGARNCDPLFYRFKSQTMSKCLVGRNRSLQTLRVIPPEMDVDCYRLCSPSLTEIHDTRRWAPSSLHSSEDTSTANPSLNVIVTPYGTVSLSSKIAMRIRTAVNSSLGTRTG